MGRKPWIGTVALTDAEKAKRWREKQKAKLTADDIASELYAAIRGDERRLWVKLGSKPDRTPEGRQFNATVIRTLIERAATLAAASAHDGGCSESEFMAQAQAAYRQIPYRNTDVSDEMPDRGKFPVDYITAGQAVDLCAKQIGDWLKAELAAGRLNPEALKTIGSNALHTAGVEPPTDDGPFLRNKIKMLEDTVDHLEGDLMQAKEAQPATGDAPWTKAQYMSVVKCLHPDRVNSVTEADLNAALLMLQQTKAHLMMGEKEEQARKEKKTDSSHWRPTSRG
jgi:hypothetical protein